MPIYGMVIEGSYDQALEEIIKNILQQEIEIISRPCGGKTQLMNKFRGHLESFRYLGHASKLEKALVIRDADGKNPEDLLQRLRNSLQGRIYPFELKFIIVVQNLETWLLADEEALSGLAQRRSGRPVSRVKEALESIVYPKEKLKTILSGVGVRYTSEVARKIAKESNTNVLENRCPSFREFRQAVLDC